NGGRLMHPQVVRAVLDSQGRVVRAIEPEVVRQVITPDTAHVLTRMMTAVVREGTGHNAAIPGYEVAGKTGTAQKLDPATRRYSRAPGVLSFVGFVPAEDPRLAMLVMLDEPKNEKWGSEAAAPIFAAIGREALRYLNVPPRDTLPVPLLRGEVIAALPPASARPGDSLDAGRVGTGILELAEDTSAVMPRVERLSLRQAMDRLAPFDVLLEVSGRGLVQGQSPDPGAPLTPGTLCRLTLASPIAKPGARGAGAAGRRLLRASLPGAHRGRHHRHQWQDDDLPPRRCAVAAREPNDRPDRHDRVSNRRRGAAGWADHSRGGRAAIASGRDGRARRHGGRHGGILSRARAPSRGRRGVRRGGVHQPDPGPPGFPPHVRGVPRRQGPALLAAGVGRQAAPDRRDQRR